jgi:hypothetical protein
MELWREPGEFGEGDELTFEEFMAIEAMLPEYSEMVPGVDYVAAGVRAGRSAARLECAMRARGAGLCRVRTLVRKDGQAHMFIELDLSTAETTARDVLDAVLRADEHHLKHEPRA